MAAQKLTNYLTTLANKKTIWGNVTNMANGDTITSPAFALVRSINFTPTTNASFGFTIAGNVITLVSGGNLSGVIAISGD
jgi:hypothetical protein